MSLASLPMYDRPETAAANDMLWQEVRERLAGDAPAQLTRDGDLWAQWLDPGLVLSQTCGFPYRARLHGKVALIGTPDTGLPDCPPGHYYSVLVVRRDDARVSLCDYARARLAYNDPLSQSGWAAPQGFAASRGFAFAETLCTGGHAASARAVAAGDADIAAIDAITWRLIARHDAFAQNLHVIARTAPTPALPFIAGVRCDTAAIFDALAGAIATLPARSRQALGLCGLLRLPASDYLCLPTPPQPG